MLLMREKNLTSGNVLNVLVAFSWPYLISSFLQQLYGLVDVLIVGRFCSTAQLGAVTTGSQFMHMITAMILGLAVGVTVLLAKLTGAGERNKLPEGIRLGFLLFGVLSLLLMVVLILGLDPILTLLHVPFEAVEACRDYLIVCLIGLLPICFFNVSSSVFRGLGDSLTPMYTIACACLVNILLDYLFVAVFSMQALGAALATVLAQALAAALAFVLMKQRYNALVPENWKAPIDKNLLSQIVGVGAPVAFQDGIIQISFLIITAIGNSLGLVSAAAIGVVEKLISFLFIVPSSLSQSLSAMAAQNIGALKYRRACSALKWAITICLIYGLMIVLLSWTCGGSLISIFTPDRQVVEAGIPYLKSYSFDTVFVAVHFCMGTYFCAFSKSTLSFIQNFLSVLFFRIPLAWLAARYHPENLFWMGLAAPAGSFFQALFCLGAFAKLRSVFFPPDLIKSEVYQ